MKKNAITLIIFLLTGICQLQAQGKFFTKKGRVYFNASAKMEKVEATNRAVVAVLDSKTGNIQFAAMLKGFEFEKALMQEHFNENYVESDKFPKAEFSGQVINNSEINYARDGSYPAKVKGTINLHGHSQDITASGTVVIKNGIPALQAGFNILLSDFKIEIPSLVSENISNETKITVDCSLEPLKDH